MMRPRGRAGFSPECPGDTTARGNRSTGTNTAMRFELTPAVERALEAARRRARLEGQGLSFARLEAAVVGVQGPPLALDEPLDLVEPREQIDAARVLDAAANRAREALRVVEDYCRFVLDDALLSGELKQLR